MAKRSKRNRRNRRLAKRSRGRDPILGVMYLPPERPLALEFRDGRVLRFDIETWQTGLPVPEEERDQYEIDPPDVMAVRLPDGSWVAPVSNPAGERVPEFWVPVAAEPELWGAPLEDDEVATTPPNQIWDTSTDPASLPEIWKWAGAWSDDEPTSHACSAAEQT